MCSSRQMVSCSSTGKCSSRFTPKGLSVSARTRWISARKRDGAQNCACRIPRPPALLTAATDSGPVRSGPIGAAMIGYSMPSMSQSTVFMRQRSLVFTEAVVLGVTAMDELVHRLRRIQHLRDDFAAPDGKRSIDEVKLDEQRSLIPVEVLAHDPVAFESDDGHDRNLHALSCRLDAGQKPVHANRVSEPNDQLIDDLALSYGSRHRNYFDVRRQWWQEVCELAAEFARLTVDSSSWRSRIDAPSEVDQATAGRSIEGDRS